MTRDEILSALESHWYAVQAEYPDEAMDIPDAMHFYSTLSDEQLLREYNKQIG